MAGARDGTTQAGVFPGPLTGKRVVLTRPAAQAGDFSERVRALGGEPVLAPAIKIAPPESWSTVDAALRDTGRFDWVAFTSANAVRALVERADAIGVGRKPIQQMQLAAIGPATAAAVEASLRPADVVARTHAADALAREMPDVTGRRVLFPRGDLAGDLLPVTLRTRGASVDEVIVYRTVAARGADDVAEHMCSGRVDAVLFASASAVHAVAGALARRETVDLVPSGIAIFCIGPMTADAARDAGLEPVAVADAATQQDLIESVARWFAAQAKDVSP